jgi:hypothetical protein
VHWIPVVAALAALTVAVIVLGFCAYELAWKTKRLRRDLTRLQALGAQLSAVQHTLTAAQQRVAAATASATGKPVGPSTTR